MMTDEKIEEVKRLLREKGIRIDLSGCGCCGSPTLSLEIDGKLIVYDEDDANIDMLKDPRESTYEPH